MKIKALITVMLTVLLCGCAYTEPNAKYTVTALGFDLNTKGSQMFLQAIDAAGGEKNGEPKTFTVEGLGTNTKAALNDIKTQLSKEASFKHCQLILLSAGITGAKLNEVLSLCETLDIPLRSRIVYCDKIKLALNSERIPSGTDIAALLKQNAKSFGYGAHTAMFEIKTAILTRGGDFALPVIRAEGEQISVNGLCRYTKSIPMEFLTVKESIAYAEENNVYEGEKE